MFDLLERELDLTSVVVIVGTDENRSTFVFDGNTSFREAFDVINKRELPLHKVRNFSVYTDRSKEPELFSGLGMETPLTPQHVDS